MKWELMGWITAQVAVLICLVVISMYHQRAVEAELAYKYCQMGAVPVKPPPIPSFTPDEAPPPGGAQPEIMVPSRAPRAPFPDQGTHGQLHPDYEDFN